MRRLAGTGGSGTPARWTDGHGVFVVGLEKATRLLGHLTLSDKEYLATVQAGRQRRTP